MKICPECLERVGDEHEYCPDDGTELRTIHARDDDPMEGRVLEEKWVLESRIGGGGMGTVYRAHQLSVDRTVAIKVLRSSLVEEDEHVERFFREANVASNISDPRCVTIYDFGQTAEDHVLYLAMEYLEGESLQERVKRETLTFEQALQVGVQICQALSHLHGHGVIHRDLKPENVVLIDEIGSDDVFLKLLDFGLAKLANSDATPVTATGKVYGTPAFMSPEQCMGSEIGFQSDLYALGCVLYELVSGATPFEGKSSVQILLAHVNRQPPPLSAHAAVPKSFDNLIGQLLAKDPDERPRSAEAVGTRLQDIHDRLSNGTAMQRPETGDRHAGSDSAEESGEQSPVPTLEGEPTGGGLWKRSDELPRGSSAPTRPADSIEEPTDSDEIRDDLAELEADGEEDDSEDDGERDEEPTESSGERTASERGPGAGRTAAAVGFVAVALAVVWWNLQGGEQPESEPTSEAVAAHETDTAPAPMESPSAVAAAEPDASTEPIGPEAFQTASAGVGEARDSARERAATIARNKMAERTKQREHEEKQAEGAPGPEPVAASASKSGGSESPDDGEDVDGGEEKGASTAGFPVLTRQAATQVFVSRNSAVEKCFERGVGEEGFDGGSVRVMVIVGGDGTVERTSIVESNVGVAGVDKCVKKEASSLEFPPPASGGHARLVHSYTFEWNALE